MGLKHHPSGCKTGLGVRCSLTARSPEVKNSAPDAPHIAINTAARMPLQYHHAPCHMMPRCPPGYPCSCGTEAASPMAGAGQRGAASAGLLAVRGMSCRGAGAWVADGGCPEAGFSRAPRGTQRWPCTIECLLVAVHSVNRAVLHASADGIRPDAPPISPGARAAAHRSPPPAAPISHRARTPASH